MGGNASVPINNLTDLVNLSSGYVSPNTTYNLTADITITAGSGFSGLKLSPANVGIVPSNTVFDGQGHTITLSGITGWSGFFQTGNIIVRNLTLDGSTSALQTTGLAGIAYVQIFINIALAYPTQTNLRAVLAAALSNSGYIGSGWFFAINAANAAAVSCTSLGPVGYFCGGFFGSGASYCTALSCTNSGAIYYMGGGIFGTFALTGNKITNCVNTGSLSAGTYAGGILGAYGFFTSDDISTTTPINLTCDISNCYNTGAIGASASGLCGSQFGYTNIGSITVTGVRFYKTANITGCYNLGAISANGSGFIGALAEYALITSSAASNANNILSISINLNQCFNRGANSGAAFVAGLASTINIFALDTVRSFKTPSANSINIMNCYTYDPSGSKLIIDNLSTSNSTILTNTAHINNSYTIGSTGSPYGTGNISYCASSQGASWDDNVATMTFMGTTILVSGAPNTPYNLTFQTEPTFNINLTCNQATYLTFTNTDIRPSVASGSDISHNFPNYSGQTAIVSGSITVNGNPVGTITDNLPLPFSHGGNRTVYPSYTITYSPTGISTTGYGYIIYTIAFEDFPDFMITGGSPSTVPTGSSSTYTLAPFVNQTLDLNTIVTVEGLGVRSYTTSTSNPPITLVGSIVTFTGVGNSTINVTSSQPMSGFAYSAGGFTLNLAVGNIVPRYIIRY
jgi:hypothetical protein